MPGRGSGRSGGSPSSQRPRAIAISICLALAATAVSVDPAFAAAPANDEFANAQPISGISGALWASTAEASTDVCFGIEDHRLRNSIWYRWTAPSSGFLRVATHGSNFDTKVQVFYVHVGCPNDGRAGGDDSVLPDGTVVKTTDTKFQVRQGVEYIIGVGGQERGSVLLRWQFIKPPPPPNDRIIHAEEILGRHGIAFGQNAQATLETGEPVHAGVAGGASIWYRWRSPFTGRAVFHTATSESDRDTTLAIYTGSQPGNLALVTADNDGASGTASRVAFQATAGVEYRIAIDTRNGLQTGILPETDLGWLGIRLHWHGGAAPPNDAFANAEVIDGRTGFLFAENIGASRQTGEPYHGDTPAKPLETWGGASVWYRWTAPMSGRVNVSARNEGDDALLLPTIAIYTGQRVDALTLVAEFGEIAEAATVSWTATKGVTYWIAVDSKGERPGPFSLSWLAVPPNDDFADARVLSGNAGVLIDTALDATAEAGEQHAGLPADQSVWYRWTPTVDDPNAAIIVQDPWLVVGIYTGSWLQSLTPVVGYSPMLTHTFSAKAGTTYSIAIDARTSTTDIRMRWIAGPRDTTPPTVALTTPSAGSTISGVMQPTATASDPSGIARVEFWIALGGTDFEVSAGIDSTAPYRGSRSGEDGPVEVFARAVDMHGNASDSARIPIEMDSEPLGFVDFVRDTEAETTTSLVYRWLKLADNSWRCSLDTAPFASCTPPVTLAGLANGYHWVRFYARDEQGRDTYGPLRELAQIGPDPALPPAPPAPGPTPTGSVTRQAGANRYATAAAVSKATYPAGDVPVAFVASGLSFPDALAGAAAAGRLGGPLLLTSTSSIPFETAAELSRLDPARIVVLGGSGVVSSSVASALDAYLR